jgi:hypothetical protein
MEPATGNTSTASADCSEPAMATKFVRPGLTPTASAPSTLAMTGSGADQVTSAPTMAVPRASTTRAASETRSPSGTRRRVSSNTSAAGRWSTTIRTRDSTSPARTATNEVPAPVAVTVPAALTSATEGSPLVQWGVTFASTEPVESVITAPS